MKHLRNLLFGLLMLMISLPLIQQIMPIFNETPLKGAYELYKKPSPTIDSILNGTFQEAFNNYAEHNIGFRANLVRINNQIAYSLFDTALANGVVIGKEHYLYEINYIKALKGWDFVGMKSITNQVNKTAFINHKLREAGKTLLLIFAPGKTRFLPEYIPDAYNAKASSDTTNYQAYIEQYSKTEVPLIDFNDWFVKMKDTASYPLFPQCGIHWSAYGVALALDSIIRYIEIDRNIDMVDFGWDSITVTDQLQNPDYDIAEGMNLLFTIPHYPMAYPRITYGNTNGKIKPNAIVVSDSFYWNIFGKGYSNRIFTDNNFWYYNKEVHNPEWPAPKTQDIIFWMR
ncbi:MAG: hypothetical protein M9948_00175 [Lentimicrobium sp.]|nr:hypothetical protein [Lentimicrobium sp.]